MSEDRDHLVNNALYYYNYNITSSRLAQQVNKTIASVHKQQRSVFMQIQPLSVWQLLWEIRGSLASKNSTLVMRQLSDTDTKKFLHSPIPVYWPTKEKVPFPQ